MPDLLSPLTLKGITLRNPIAITPDGRTSTH